jgi:hypothetical protein
MSLAQRARHRIDADKKQNDGDCTPTEVRPDAFTGLFTHFWSLRSRLPGAICSQYHFSPLFVYNLDLLIDHLPGKPVDGDMHPVVLFPFDDEIALETGGVWLKTT